MSSIHSVISSLQVESTALGQAKALCRRFDTFKTASWTQLQHSKALDVLMALVVTWETNEVLSTTGYSRV